MDKLEFRIRGMDCAEEADVLKGEIGPLAGGESHFTFDLLRGKMHVQNSSAPALDIIRAVKTGMQAELWSKPFEDAVKEASIGRVQPKIMTASTAILGLLPLLVLRLHGTEIEKPLAIVMVGGLLTSTLCTLLALPTFYIFVDRVKRHLTTSRT